MQRSKFLAGAPLTCFVALVLLAAVAWGEERNPAEKASAKAATSEVGTRVIFTTELDAEGKPLNNLDKISIEKTIIFYVKLYDLEDRQDYDFGCRVYDGKGDLMHKYTDQFTADGDSWNFWCSYSPDKRTDVPGTWEFEGFLDGERLIESELSVTP